MIEKVDGSNKGNSAPNMERWERAINENKEKNEERTGITDRGQRAAKSETGNKVGDYECKTCAARRYKDQSNDSSVSFQTPTHIPASQSASAVISHEMEHVTNENAKARRENREVIHSSVSIQYAICPECGARYAAGGETRTVTKAEDKEKEQQEWQEMLEKQNRRGDSENGKIVNAKA